MANEKFPFKSPQEYMLEEEELSNNPEPRAPIVICVDCSFSMRQQHRLERVMEGLDTFCQELAKDEIACASAEVCIVSYGGDTTGYQIPFNVHYTGVKTKGTFNISTKTFTAA